MNKFIAFAAMSLMTVSITTIAAPTYDMATVISVSPVTRTVHVPVQRQECWTETVATRRGGTDSYTPTIVGGIVGGVLGNQVGSGSGRTAATAAGALLGGSMGRDYGNTQGQVVNKNVRRCRTVDRGYDEERAAGYNVQYKYNDVTYTTHMSRDPGATVKVRVDTKVTPVLD